jgi:hypothetical protein
MPIEQELLDLMLDTVTLEPSTGFTKYNDPTYGTPIAVQCHIVRMNKRALDRSGREVTSTVQVILADPTLEIDTNARLTLPDGSRPAIVQLNAEEDDQGPYLLEVWA